MNDENMLHDHEAWVPGYLETFLLIRNFNYYQLFNRRFK